MIKKQARKEERESRRERKAEDQQRREERESRKEKEGRGGLEQEPIDTDLGNWEFMELRAPSLAIFLLIFLPSFNF